MAHDIHCFVSRDGNQERPETVAVAELREATGARAQAEAFESAERHIFFVSDSARYAAELAARQFDHLLEITFPQLLSRSRFASLHLPDPVSDRVTGCQRWTR